MLFNLSSANSIANHFLRALRDPILQKDRTRFRNNVEKLGEIMAYEISKKLPYEPALVQTPLGKTSSHFLKEKPVLITVLRAGLPYFNGFQHYFEESDCGFIGAYRKEEDEITVQLDYLATPGLQNRIVILIDPMLATGKSFVRSVDALLKHGKPSHIHIASLVASPQGIQFVADHLKVNYSIWTFAQDETLNQQSYIVPGLGDAGDLCFGEKL